MSSAIAHASCTVASTWPSRELRASVESCDADVCPRSPYFERRSAGSSPNSTPVTTDSRATNASTGGSIAISSSRGNTDGAKPFRGLTYAVAVNLSSHTPANAIAIATRPANTDSTRLSVRTCRAMRQRVAPSERRIAISCWRRVPRTSNKIRDVRADDREHDADGDDEHAQRRRDGRRKLIERAHDLEARRGAGLGFDAAQLQPERVGFGTRRLERNSVGEPSLRAAQRTSCWSSRRRPSVPRTPGRRTAAA